MSLRPISICSRIGRGLLPRHAGTDFATLVDAFARREAEGKRAPRPMVVPHESVAVGMAHGAWLATGRRRR